VVLNDSVVRELSQQLVRVGSNLNQVTRLAHIEAREGRVDAAGLGRVVAVIDQTRATIAELDFSARGDECAVIASITRGRDAGALGGGVYLHGPGQHNEHAYNARVAGMVIAGSSP